MDRDTSLKVWEHKRDEETLEQRIARLAAVAPADQPVALPQTIRTSDTPLVDLAFLTLTELHDLVYAASSTYLQTLSSMTKQRAHLHASRIAATAEQITAGQDYMSRGSDPRA